MQLLQNIKKYFYDSVLLQRGTARTTRTVVNIANAKTIGIIYDASLPDHDITITKFAEMLRNKGKTVEILAYTDDKKIDHKGDIKVINPNGINWYGIPKDERVTTFCTQPFDLLLCVLLTASMPLEYIAYLSHAKYRVGLYDETKTRFYDLMIHTGERKDMGYLLQQMMSFLEQMK